MTDDVKKHLVGGMQRLAAGAFGVGIGLVMKDPMAGMAASAAAMTATDYMKAKISGDDADLALAEETVALEYCRRLDARLADLEAKAAADGQKPDRQDLLTKEVTFSRFAKSLGEATTEEKREAIVHATAYQFDPRKGPPAMRDYWLRRVRDLPEHELSLVLLIANRGPIVFYHEEVLALEPQGNGGSHVRDLDFPRESRQALLTIAHQMIGSVQAGRLIAQSDRSLTIPRDGANQLVRPFALTPDGEILVSFCKDD